VRGSPLLRAFCAFCLIAALGWPLWQLTHAVEAPPPPEAAPATAEAKTISLQLDFTIVPKRFVVRHLEKEVWAEEAPEATMDREITLVFPEKGIDLTFHIEWPEDATLAAARVRLTDPTGDRREKGVWGKGTVEEALTFP
jgi:hypothetical protein